MLIHFIKARFNLEQVTHLEWDLWLAEAVEIYKPKKRMDSAAFKYNMKKRFNVSSRRINKWVSKKTVHDEPEIMSQAMIFVHELNEEAAANNISDRAYWNSDQSRFEYECKRDRTYSKMGIKMVEVMA